MHAAWRTIARHRRGPQGCCLVRIPRFTFPHECHGDGLLHACLKPMQCACAWLQLGSGHVHRPCHGIHGLYRGFREEEGVLLREALQALPIRPLQRAVRDRAPKCDQDPHAVPPHKAGAGRGRASYGVFLEWGQGLVDGSSEASAKGRGKGAGSAADNAWGGWDRAGAGCAVDEGHGPGETPLLLSHDDDGDSRRWPSEVHETRRDSVSTFTRRRKKPSACERDYPRVL